MDGLLQSPLPLGATAIGSLAIAICGFSLFFIKWFVNCGKGKSSRLPLPPRVPGLPVLGNLLQLKEKKPHKTFTLWAEKYGPIYSIKTGSKYVVVLNSNHVAKEALVENYSAISTRNLPRALQILSADKIFVALSNYNEHYKLAKRYLHRSTLSPTAQKQHLIHREMMIKNMCQQFHAHLKEHPFEAINFREIFESELFGLSLKEAIGEDMGASIYVEELNTTLLRSEVYKILVVYPMQAVIQVDWRDHFPYLKWFPNKNFEDKIQQIHVTLQAVMKALIAQQKKRIASGKEVKCYLDYLLSETRTFSENQILMLIWEAILEGSDTTLITSEWAMYELAKNGDKQNRLLMEIQETCGSNKLEEKKLHLLPYLAAVFQETLRKHGPVPILPFRYVHEDTQLGGYHIPKGSEIAINIYGCNMDPKVWLNPGEWNPERFMTGKDDAMELFKTLAFGGGKRVCAGALQAMLVSCAAIGRLVQEFEWTVKDGEGENEDTLAMTTHKLHPLLVNLKPRN